MSKVASAHISITADSQKMIQELRKATNEIRRFRNSTQRDVNRAKYALNSLRRASQLVASAFIFTAGAKRLGNLVLSIERAEEQMTLLTMRMNQFARTNDGFARTYALSQRLGVSLQETGQQMTRLLVSTKKLGTSQADVEKMFENLVILGRLGGTSLEELTGGLRQFTQGLSSDRLQGEELRSVLENLPLVAMEIAKELDADIGKIRQLAKEGKITGEVMVRAILGVEKKLEEMPTVFSQEVAKMKTEWDLLLAALGEEVNINVVVRLIGEKTKQVREDWLGNFRHLKDDELQSRLSEASDDLRAWGAEVERLQAERPIWGSDAWFKKHYSLEQAKTIINERAAIVESAIEQIRERAIAAAAMANADRAREEGAKVFVPLSETARRPLLEEILKQNQAEIDAFGEYIAEYESMMDAAGDANLEYAKTVETIREMLRDNPLYDVADALRDIELAESKRLKDLYGTDELEEISYKDFGKFKTDLKEKTDELNVFAEQAARNIQDTFADFLFDPFDQGLKGMLQGFIDTLRRMVAEAASAFVLNMLFKGTPLEGFFPGFGKRAAGGPVSSGTPYMVGEKGPELFVPNGSGTIVPNHKLTGGGVTVVQNNNIDARGATQDVIKMLPGILAQNRAAAVNEVRELVRRGSL